MPAHKPIRLPPLKKLRVHDPKRKVEQPCVAVMSTVLGKDLPTPPLQTPGCCRGAYELVLVLTDGLRGVACWASAGYNAAGCAAVENQLRKCMDGPKAPPPGTNTVNYHLSRMKSNVISRGKV
jgi:hypothetical protein